MMASIAGSILFAGYLATQVAAVIVVSRMNADETREKRPARAPMSAAVDPAISPAAVLR